MGQVDQRVLLMVDQWVFDNCVDGGSMGFFFFFLINCVGVLGLHGGDGDDEW